MIFNPHVEQIAKEYNLDMETLHECIANSCRKTFGLLEVREIREVCINAYSLGEDGKIHQKEINITKAGMKRLIKGIALEIESITLEDKKVLEMLSYKSVLTHLEKDIESISKSKVSLRVIGVRMLTDKEKKKNTSVDIFVIVRADRYLTPAENKYFSLKSTALKQRTSFVLA